MTLTRKQLVAAAIIAAAIPFGLLLTSYFVIHDGLPTGDSQKAIIWGQQILDTGWPNYGASSELLNRDPVDFYTPALHYFTAVILAIGGLTGIGLAAIMFTIATAFVCAAIAWRPAPPRWQIVVAGLTFFLT